MAEDIHRQEDQRHRHQRGLYPSDHRLVIKWRQPQQADEKPQHQHDIASCGYALKPPVVCARFCRTQAAYAADAGSRSHYFAPRSRIAAQTIAVAVTEPTIVIVAHSLLVRSS